MHAAITIKITNPRTQQEPMDIMIPYGTALAAFDASSLICTQESKAPIVQIGESHASIKDQPVGQVVRFSSWAKI